MLPSEIAQFAHHGTVARRCVGQCEAAFLGGLAVLRNEVVAQVLAEAGVVVAVDDIDLAVVLTELHGRVDVLHLVVFGRERAVAHHYAVHAERFQVGLVAEVATIENWCFLCSSPFLISHFPFLIGHYALVHPVPDEAAEHARVAVHLVPVVLEVAQGVAHAVGILAGHDGALVVGALGNLEQAFPACILGALGIAAFGDARVQVFGLDAGVEARDDVDGGGVGGGAGHVRLHRLRALCTLVVYEAGGVELVEPARHGGVVGTVAALVA